MYLCPSFTDQSPPNFAQTSIPTQGRYLTQVWPHQPDSLIPGYLKLQNLNRSLEKKLWSTKNVLNFFPAVLYKTKYDTHQMCISHRHAGTVRPNYLKFSMDFETCFKNPHSLVSVPFAPWGHFIQVTYKPLHHRRKS